MKSQRALIFNIGKLVSGDINNPLLKADSILIENGRISQIGWESEIGHEGVDQRIDANAMTVTPGLIDSHVHNSIGDWSQIFKAVDWMESSLLAGTTTMISQGENVTAGLREEPAAVKALAILSAKTWHNFRPGGALKVHGGCVMLAEGLTDRDFKEMKAAGVWAIAEIGGWGFCRPIEKVVSLVKIARKYKMKVSMHFALPGIPSSEELLTDEALEIKPDVCCHVNMTATCGAKEIERVVKETECALEYVWASANYKAGYDMMNIIKERKQLERLIIGSDNPIGSAFVPPVILRCMTHISSMNEIPAEKVIAGGTGNTARIYGLNTGKIEEGREADVLVIDRPIASRTKNALEAMEVGDLPGTAMIMVDGRIVGVRGRDTRRLEKNVKVNGVELKVRSMEEYLFGPMTLGYNKSTSS
jgi:enamidase